MKKKILVTVGIVIFVLFVIGLITGYKDSARVRAGIEPKYVIKTVSYHGDKVTYWGLGYKVVRYVNVSQNEPFSSNMGIDFYSLFSNYEMRDKKSDENEEHVVMHDNENITANNSWQVSKVDGNSIPCSISEDDSRKIQNIIASCKYEIGTADCLNDYKFTRNDGTIIYYHSDCGTFNDNEAKRSYRVLEEQKTWINDLLFSLFESTYYTGAKRSADDFEFYSEMKKNTPVTLEIKTGTLSSDGLTLAIKNNSNYDYTYGPDYYIEKLENGNWIELETITGDPLTWNSIAYNLKSGEEKEEVIDFKFSYGKLPSGYYRIIKSVLKDEDIPITENKIEKIMIDFEIK